MSKNKSELLFKCLFFVFAVLYLFAVIKIVFLKDGIRVVTDTYRLIPFNSIYEYKLGLKSASSLAVNYLGNIAMFFPLGIFLPVFFKKLNLAKVVLIGFFLSLAVELFQFLSSSGYADIDDIIMNTAGTMLGAFTYFYIFGGKKKSIASYILSLILIIAIEIGSLAGIWYLAPNILPDKMIAINGMIAGKRLDSYDASMKCYKMSHGEIFIIKNTVQDKNGNKIDKKDTYFLSDRAIYVIESREKGYHVVGIDNMIDAVAKIGEANVKIWLSDTGECSLVLLETE